MDKPKPTGASCCGGTVTDSQPSHPPVDAPWIEGLVDTPFGGVPRVSTTLRFADRLGACKARWAIGRMHYAIAPGLYAVGSPTPETQVFVSANYKMSFDRLRSQLDGRDGWIMVLDTKGINVWCAAGKGTFGTDEIVSSIEAVRLGEVVSHRRLVLPQLGAPGVSAHEVKRRTGFRALYGPVRVEDLPAFLDAGMKATPEMRRVGFPLRSRMAVVPVELVLSAKYALFIAACFVLVSGLGRDGYSAARVKAAGLSSAALFLVGWLAGGALVPALLPWLPGRSFSAKGAWTGLAAVLAIGAYAWASPNIVAGDWLSVAAWLLMIPAVASFLGMNFTGASTYTSLSGVQREMRIAVPIQITAASVGVVLWLVGRFV